jgi:hypothetical protein
MLVTITAGCCPRDNVNKLRPAAHYLKYEDSSAVVRDAVSIYRRAEDSMILWNISNYVFTNQQAVTS